MDPFAWLVVLTVGVTFVALATNRFSTELVLLTAVCLLLVAGGDVYTAADALGGFAHTGMLTIAVLYVVSAGIRETGAIWFVVNSLLGNPKGYRPALARLVLPVAGVSAFVNNTPLVAVLLPVIQDWARKRNFAASKLLIPLSYAAILGGTATLIGTSTNLLVAGELKELNGYQFGFFEISPVGIPCILVGLAFLLTVGPRILPDRKTPTVQLEDPKEYTLEMRVDPKSPLVGKTIEQAGMRHLPGVYLMEIAREGETIPTVGPKERLEANDQLVFVGVVDSVVDLQKFPGLKVATDQVFKLGGSANGRELFEGVVSHTSPMMGKSIREGRFRTTYNAAVIAVARNGERVLGKIGDIVLQPGDTLLLEALPSFLEKHRDSKDFYLVSRIEGYTPPSHDKAWLALAILAAMVLLAATGMLTILKAGLLASGAMLATGCCTVASARRSLDGRVLVSIAAALGLGRALEVSGAAGVIVEQAMAVATGDAIAAIGLSIPMAALIMIYAAAMLSSELLTNNASAALLFPFAIATGESLGVSYMPYVVAVMVASSMAFATPIGYQTNLMVLGPGGYRFSDFIKVGLPLDLVIFATAVATIPFVFPFVP